MEGFRDEHWGLVTPMLALFEADADWGDAPGLSTREKQPNEIGFRHCPP